MDQNETRIREFESCIGTGITICKETECKDCWLEDWSELDQQIIRYFKLDKNIKELDKPYKELNKVIKTDISKDVNDGESKKVLVQNIEVNYQSQERVSINQEKLLELLKTRGLTKAIKTVEIPDATEVEQLIYDGVLTPEELAPLNETKYIEVLKIKQIKEKKSKK